jgi:putative tricarboxylic transport membrane protein
VRAALIEEDRNVSAGKGASTFARFSLAELASSALIAALGVYIVLQARAWVYMTTDGPGPGFFPWWIGAALLVLAVLNSALHVRDALRGRALQSPQWKGSGRVFVGWLAFMVAAALLKPLGFVVTLALLVLFLVVAVFRRPLAPAIALALGSALGFWLLFSYVLEVQLPAGPWGF